MRIWTWVGSLGKHGGVTEGGVSFFPTLGFTVQLALEEEEGRRMASIREKGGNRGGGA